MTEKKTDKILIEKAAKIKLLLTDCDGVLTDAGVYYTAQGEEMKRFSVRDGMGVERLRKLANVETGIITGENSFSVARRASKLNITELHLGCKNKALALEDILQKNNLLPEETAFIGDDMNDLDIMQMVGLSACPADAMEEIAAIAHFICWKKGGHGAFREFAEFIIQAKQRQGFEENTVTNLHHINITLANSQPC